MTEISTVAFVGSGKVASVLSDIFIGKGIVITGVSSRNLNKGKLLADKLNCSFIEDHKSLEADLIIIAINDDSVKTIVEQIESTKRIAYTAGSIDLSEINHPNCIVFYPLQTFTEEKNLQPKDIPILLEAKDPTNLNLLENFCTKLNFQFNICSSIERKQYHLAAVFINNFVNHLVFLAKEETDNRNLQWNILQPLLEETCNKLLNQDLYSGQTGPAKRNDLRVISEQKKMLSDYKLEIYEAITKSIIETYKND